VLREPGGFIQVLHPLLTSDVLLKLFPPACRIYHYNGHSFDLRILKKATGVDLRARCDSIDLMWACRKDGVRGTLKKVERYFGLRRGDQTPQRIPPSPVELWRRWKAYGDKRALNELLEYNEADVRGMVPVRDALLLRGAIPGRFG